MPRSRAAAVLVTLSGRWGRILGATPAGPLRPQGSRGDLAPPMEPRPVPSSTGQGPRSDAGLRAGAGIGTRVLVAGLVAGLGALGLALFAACPVSAGVGSAGTAAVLLVLASYGSVAVILALRRPRNPLGWIFFGVLAIVELTTLAESLGGTAVLAGAPLPGGLANVLIWFESWGFALLFALIFAVTLVFPSGHLPARRAGRAARAALAAIPVGLAVIAFGPKLGGVYGEAHVRNPFGILPISDRVWVIPYLAIVALLVAGVISMLVRFHRARGVERQQLKWLAAATALAAAAIGGTLVLVISLEAAGARPGRLERDDQHEGPADRGRGQRRRRREPLELLALHPAGAMETHEHRDDAGDQEGDDREVRDDPDAIENRQNAERVPDVRFAVDAAELGAEGDHGQPHRDGAKGRPGGSARAPGRQVSRREDEGHGEEEGEEEREAPALEPDQDVGESARERCSREDSGAAQRLGQGGQLDDREDPEEDPAERIPWSTERQDDRDRAVGRQDEEHGGGARRATPGRAGTRGDQGEPQRAQPGHEAGDEDSGADPGAGTQACV